MRVRGFHHLAGYFCVTYKYQIGSSHYTRHVVDGSKALERLGRKLRKAQANDVRDHSNKW